MKKYNFNISTSSYPAFLIYKIYLAKNYKLNFNRKIKRIYFIEQTEKIDYKIKLLKKNTYHLIINIKAERYKYNLMPAHQELTQNINIAKSIASSFDNGEGKLSWASLCGDAQVQHITVKKKLNNSDAEIIYDGTSFQGTINDTIQQEGFSYWVEAICSDGKYYQTPILYPSSGRNTASTYIPPQEYELLLKFLGLDKEEISSAKLQNHATSLNKNRGSINLSDNISQSLVPITHTLAEEAHLAYNQHQPPSCNSNPCTEASLSSNPVQQIVSLSSVPVPYSSISSSPRFFYSSSYPSSLSSQYLSCSQSQSYATSSVFSVPEGQFVRYYIWDHLGSTRIILRRFDKQIIESNKFLPFGEEIKPYSDIHEPHKFAGYLRDSESNIDYLGLRYYNNSIFRFLTTDIIKNSSNNPQTWNPYLICKKQSTKLHRFIRLNRNSFTVQILRRCMALH